MIRAISEHLCKKAGFKKSRSKTGCLEKDQQIVAIADTMSRPHSNPPPSLFPFSAIPLKILEAVNGGFKSMQSGKYLFLFLTMLILSPDLASSIFVSNFERSKVRLLNPIAQVMTLFVIIGTNSVHAQPAPANTKIFEMNEKGYKDQYDTIATNLMKLPQELRPSMALSSAAYPHTKWFWDNKEFFASNADLVHWLITDTQQSLECKNLVPEKTIHVSEDPEQNAEIERRVLGLVDSALTITRLVQYAKLKSSFKDCGLDEAELAVIFGYTGGFYQHLNPALRNGYTDSDLESFTRTLDRGLDKLRDYSGWVYRGVTLPNSVKRQYVKGAIVSDLAYTSTGLNGGFFGSDQLHILSRTGKYIAPVSKSPSENEVLFKRGTKFKVIESHPDQLHPEMMDYTLEEVP